MTRAWQDLRKARWGAEGQVGAGGQVGGCAPPPAQLGYGKVWGLERVGGSLMVAGMGSGAGGWQPDGGRYGEWSGGVDPHQRDSCPHCLPPLAPS